VHERRVPLYGAFILPADQTLAPGGDLIDLDMPLEECRRFSDGRSSYLVRHLERKPQLACYRRSVQLEADLIEIQQATGIAIVQRTVMGVPRMISADGVIEWTGRVWSMRPSARRLFAAPGALDRRTAPLPRAARRADADRSRNPDHGVPVTIACPTPQDG
jgi:hypothetical protein